MAETTKIPARGRVWKDRETGIWRGEHGDRGSWCAMHSWESAYRATETSTRALRYRAFRRAGVPAERLPHYKERTRG